MIIDYSEYWADRDENGPLSNIPVDQTGSRGDW